MSIDTEHLAEDDLADLEELVGEPGSFAQPFGLGVCASELGERSRGDSRVLGVGDAARVCGEDVDIVNLAGDPTLHESHVLMGWKLDRLAVLVEPGEGVVSMGCQRSPQQYTYGVSSGDGYSRSG